MFAEIGTSTTTSYVDSGLLATTSYTYRVRATDAALLMGPYTGEVSVTTGSVTLIGLLAAYGFDEGTGSATLDGSGRGNSGTLTGGATWATGRSGKRSGLQREYRQSCAAHLSRYRHLALHDRSLGESKRLL